MGSCKIDSSDVYTLFEELKQKIDELDKNATPNGQTDLTFDIDEFISLIEDLKVHINQQQFSPEQIKIWDRFRLMRLIKLMKAQLSIC